MISSKLVGKGIKVSLSNGKNIVFTTEATGEEQYFSDIGGTAYNTILAGTGYREPIIKEGGISTSSITVRTEVGNNFVIDDTNNELSFTYVDEGVEYKIDVELENNQNTSIGFIVNDLNNKIRSKLQEYQEQSLLAMKYLLMLKGKIKISTKNPILIIN